MAQHKSFMLGLVMLVLSTLTVSLLLVNSGCTPPKPKIDPVAEKARQDSILKVQQEEYLRQLAIYWSTGYEYWKSKMFARAVPSFWKVAEEDTIQKFKDVWTKLVQCYYGLENPDSAQIAAEKGLKVYPDNLYLLRNLAYLYSNRDMIDKAIELNQKIVELDPNGAEDFKKLGNLYLKNDDVDAAIEAYETASTLNPEDQEVNNILSQLYSQTGNDDAALERLEKLREQDPENPKHMYDLGRQYFTRQLFEKAEPQFRAFTQKKPDDIMALEYLAASLQNQEKYEQAINVYQTILNKKADHNKAMCEIALCLKFQKKFSQARTYVKKALAIDNSFGYAYIALGEIYEACADNCIEKRGKSKTTFDDKLVYQLAYDQYRKATEDPSYSSDAQRKVNYVKPLLPTTEDNFMNKNRTKAQGACYSWIY